MKTNKKSFCVYTAVLHFITAGVVFATLAYIYCTIHYGNLLPFDNEPDSIGDSYVAIFGFMSLLCSCAATLLSVPSFIISGCKLTAQARGGLPAGKSFVVTLLLKIVAFFIMLYGLMFMFGLADTATGVILVVLHSISIVFTVLSSILEVCVRRKP